MDTGLIKILTALKTLYFFYYIEVTVNYLGGQTRETDMAKFVSHLTSYFDLLCELQNYSDRNLAPFSTNKKA